MKKLAIAGALALVLIPVAALAQNTSVNVGSPLVQVLIAYASVVGTAVAALASWVMWRLTGIRLDAESRAAIETFATNAAGEFLNKYGTLKGVKVDVHNELIAALAQAALTRIPDGLAHFGWGIEQVKQRIVEKIGVLTAAATTVSAAPVTTKKGQ